MKHHAIPAAIAVAVAAATATGLDLSKGPRQVTREVTSVTHSVNASKHAWPDLSTEEQAALARELAWLKGGKVVIFCEGADCRDLQTDLDNALEDAGVDSTRDRPMFSLGYGVRIVAAPGDTAAERLAAALSTTTTLHPTVMHAEGVRGLMITIGKRPR